METQPITLSATISFWAHFRATRAIVNRMWSTYAAWCFFAGVPLLLLVVMLCRGQDIFAPGLFGLPAWAIAVIGLLFMLCFMPLMQCLNIASMRRRNSSVGGVQTYIITPDSYTVRGSLFDSTIKWDAFYKAIETKEFIFLYLSTRAAHFIPKAAATESDLRAIRTIIQEKLVTKAKLQAI